MGTQSPITGQAITNVLKSKVQHAYNTPPTGPFTVENIQTHKADLTYTVTAEYSTKIESKPSGRASAGAYSKDDLHRALAARKMYLLLDPGKVYREQMLGRLVDQSDLFKKDTSFALVRDDQNYYCNETCHGCSGKGTSDCSTCRGTAKVACNNCSDGRVTCTGCSGYGNTAHSSSCNNCSGNRMKDGVFCRSCNGTGKPGSPCGYCSATGKRPCDRCGGSTRLQCTACRRGQVTCGTCQGACELSYQYHLDVYVSTSVTYSWGSEIPDWFRVSLKEAARNSEMDSVFHVTTYETKYNQPNIFVGKGYAIGSEATVGYQGAVGQCKFIGESLIPVYLDGVLSGEFQKSIDGVSDPTKISKVGKASRNNIARELITEVEEGIYFPAISTPVQRGVISEDQATEFLAGRAKAKTYIEESQKTFKPGRILQFSLRLTFLLFTLYLVAYIASDMPPLGEWKKAARILSLTEAFQNPMFVFQKFIHPFEWMYDQYHNNTWPFRALWFPFCAILFNKYALPLLFPRLWDWNKNIMASLVLSIPGMAILAFLLAIFPASYIGFNFENVTSYSQVVEVMMTLTAVGVMVPKIWGWALIIALIRYPAAGQYWARRMYRKLSPKT